MHLDKRFAPSLPIPWLRHPLDAGAGSYPPFRSRSSEGLQDSRRPHRQRMHPHACGIRDCIGDSRQRRADRGFAHAANAIWMAGIRHFHYNRVDHGQIACHRYPVIQETRVLQPSVLAIDVFLVQRPANALRRASLILALYIGWMNRLARILNNRIARDFRGSRFAVNLSIDNMCRERKPRLLPASPHNVRQSARRCFPFGQRFP